MSETNVAERPLEGHEATEQGIEGSLSDFSESLAANLVEQSNGASELPVQSITRTHQDDVGIFPENALETMNQVDHDDAKSGEDTARDDMFVDCPDELGTFDGRHTDIKEETDAGESRQNLEEDEPSHFGKLDNGAEDESVAKTVANKEINTREYKEEQEAVVQGVFDIYCQLKETLPWQQSLPDEAEAGGRNKEAQLGDIPLKEMIKECLEFVKTTKEERFRAEATIRNLHALLSEKDHQIENLNTKVTELVVSHDNSTQKTLEVSSEIDIVVDRLMSSLATVVSQEKLLDNTISGKIVYIEEGTALLTAKYNNILSEIYQLGQSFSEVGLDARDEDHGNTLAAARGGLLELKRKETESFERLVHLEYENRKLLDELDKERLMIGTLNAEIGNMKVELEQEKVKCANTKEKLSMAVTKGKALVQQRDSLKKSLAEKSSEHEQCLLELQEKSSELEAARLTKDELVQSENLVASLQNSLLQSNMIIEQVEKILSQTEPDTPNMDMLERLSWVVDDRDALKGSFLEFCKLRDALSLISLPESVSSSDLESKINWLGNSYDRVMCDINILQQEISTIKEEAHNCIDFMSASFLLESLEKNFLQSELTDFRCTYEEIIEMNHQFSREKEQIVKMVVDLSGYNIEDGGIDSSSPDTFMIINHCFEIIKEQSGHFSRPSHIDTDLIERIQSHLYVGDQRLMLCEDILEEEMVIRSEVNKLANDLKTASDEIHVLKEEKSYLQKDLDRSEEKSAILKDKLSMAVKKGKGLVQDRENLKNLINEKNLEIEQLRLDLQKQESVVSEYSDQINKLSSDLESIAKLEAELQAVNGERNQFEQLLFQRNSSLQRLVESIDHIHLPVDSVFEEPLEKVKWLAGFVSECQDAKLYAERELQVVREGANNLESKLEEAQATVESLKQALSSTETKFSQVADGKREVELGKAKVEEELHEVKEEHATLSNEKELAQASRAAAEIELERVKEEAATLTSKLAVASAAIKDLEEVHESTMSLRAALSQAEKDIEAHSNEKELAQTGRAAAEAELERVKEEVTSLTMKLAEASTTIKDLEEVVESTALLRAALSQAEKDIAVLSNEKELALTSRAVTETELEKVKEEAARLASELAEASATIKNLEEVGEATRSLRVALSQAEKDIAVLSNEKDTVQLIRAAVETELERVKEETARLTGKLAEASTTIEDLEDTLSRAESNVNVLKDKYDADQVAKTKMESELKKLQDEAGHQASKVIDASETIKTLEDALLKAKNNIYVLEDANKTAKEEISSLNFKLNSCLDELSSKNGSLENRSIELIGLVNDLTMLLKENILLPKVEQCFKTKFEALQNMDLILNKIMDYPVGLTAQDPGRHRMLEEDPLVRKTTFGCTENYDVEVDSRVMNGTDINDMISQFGNIVKGFRLRNKLTADMFDDFSDSIDKFISLLQTKLLHTETDVVSILEHLETLKEKVNAGESIKAEQENTIATLENDITDLLSACADASHELQSVVNENLMEPGPISETKNLDDDALAKYNQNSKCMDTARKLISASRKAKYLIKNFEFQSKESDRTVVDLLNQLKETRAASEEIIKERDLGQNRVLQLEFDIQTLQKSCSELRNNLEGYHALEKTLKEKEKKISSLYSSLSTKQEEAENSLLSESQVRTLFGKIDRIEIPCLEAEEDMEPNTSAPVKKLFNIIDSVIQLHYQMSSLAHEKEELQTNVATKDLEIKHLEEEVKQLNRNWEDLDKVKNEMSGFTFTLEKILTMAGASDWVEDKKSAGLNELMPVLEKQVMAILLESESAKSKATELGGKLVGSQKLIDELTTKVKLLEGSLNGKTSQMEVVQERSLFETPTLAGGSEISEVEEGSLGKKVITPAPSAALVRNMRKGSTDHLALDIDGESDRLISRADVDEDKGHVFKSLNTSGFVPKQGKFIADRIDGIWVSGGRLLMSRPRARLGLLCYSLLLHIWLLATIL